MTSAPATDFLPGKRPSTLETARYRAQLHQHSTSSGQIQTSNTYLLRSQQEQFHTDSLNQGSSIPLTHSLDQQPPPPTNVSYLANDSDRKFRMGSRLRDSLLANSRDDAQHSKDRSSGAGYRRRVTAP